MLTKRDVCRSISVQDVFCFSHKRTHVCPLTHTQIKYRCTTCSNQIRTLLNFYGWCKYVQAELRKPDASNRWRAARNFPGTAMGDVCRAAAYRSVKKNSIWVSVCASEWVIGREIECEAPESLNDWTDSIESMTQWQIPEVLNHLSLSTRDKEAIKTLDSFRSVAKWPNRHDPLGVRCQATLPVNGREGRPLGITFPQQQTTSAWICIADKPKAPGNVAALSSIKRFLISLGVIALRVI